eukprot:1228485-Amphidinium_carterae.1
MAVHETLQKSVRFRLLVNHAFRARCIDQVCRVRLFPPLSTDPHLNACAVTLFKHVGVWPQWRPLRWPLACAVLQPCRDSCTRQSKHVVSGVDRETMHVVKSSARSLNELTIRTRQLVLAGNTA